MAINKVTSGGIADGTLSVEDIADDAVTAAKLANSINTDIATGVTGNTTANAALPKAGGTMTGDINFGDNDKANFGAGADLKIYHDGSNSYISDTGAGNLKIKSGAGFDLQTTTGENYLDAVENAAINLYYDNSKKLATTSTGINVTGSVTADGLAVDSSTALFPTFTTTSATSDVAINLVANSNNYTLGYDYSSNALKVVRGTMSSTTGLIIESTGAVTMPAQPAFNTSVGTVVSNFATDSSSVVVPFDTEAFDVGSNFASNTFTAPVTGKYQLNTTVRLNQVDTGAAYYRIELQTSNRIYKSIRTYNDTADPTYAYHNLSILAEMDAGDIAKVNVVQSGGTAQTDVSAGDQYSNFSGYLAC